MKQGFTLIETLVALSILITMISVPVFMVIRFSRESNRLDKEMQAHFLAQDGLEQFKSFVEVGIVKTAVTTLGIPYQYYANSGIVTTGGCLGYQCITKTEMTRVNGFSGPVNHYWTPFTFGYTRTSTPCWATSGGKGVPVEACRLYRYTNSAPTSSDNPMNFISSNSIIPSNYGAWGISRTVIPFYRFIQVIPIATGAQTLLGSGVTLKSKGFDAIRIISTVYWMEGATRKSVNANGVIYRPMN